MSDVIIPYRFLVRGGTAANLATVNETPRARELIVETDTGLMKLGDGVTAYNSLSYMSSVALPAFSYLSDTGSTADSDPGQGLFKWNNATQSSATVLYIDDATADTSHTDLSPFYSALAAAAGEGFIHIAHYADSSKWQLWKWTAITDGAGYFKFTVTLMALSASLADNVPVRMTFTSLGGGGGTGAMTHVATATVSGAAATTLTMSGLDLSMDQHYVVFVNLENATGSSASISLFYNGDTTATNYYTEFLGADNTTVSAARNNTGVLVGMNASSHVVARADIERDQDGNPRAVFAVNRHAPSAIQLAFSAHIRNNTANVTSITLSSSVANSLAIGSFFKVFKVVS